VVSLRQLLAVDVAAVRSAALGWRRLAAATVERWREVTTVAAALPAAWTGIAARAARRRIETHSASLASCATALVAIDQTLTWYADQLEAAQNRALAAADVAPGVSSKLEIGAPPVDPTQRAAVTWAATEVQAAAQQAALADQATAARLRALTGHLVTGASAEAPGAPAATPPCDAAPEMVARWWAGLTDTQRWTLITQVPAVIGPLDGVPVLARDQANRLLLQDIRQRLAARQQELAGQPAARQELDRLDTLAASVDAVNGRLQAAIEPRAYLLGLDTSGGGHAIVAIGNPDTADNVATFVPGLGAGISHLSTEIGRADRLVHQAATQAPTERTAAVMWLAYDRPDDLLGAARGDAARHAEASLDRFVDGLHATAQRGDTHYAVVGHSYGSVVVGTAAHDVGLATDDLVFVGSPGVGVDAASELNVPPDHVWASTAEHDAIKSATAPVPEALHFGVPAVLRPALGVESPLMWFGHNPTDPDFGGHVFASDPGSPLHPIDAHNAYFDNGGTGLANIGRIVVGGDAYAQVR
jgi:hypothetical protein